MPQYWVRAALALLVVASLGCVQAVAAETDADSASQGLLEALNSAPVAEIAAVIAALAAAWAAIQSTRAVKATQSTAEAQIVVGFLTEYFTPRFSDAMMAVALSEVPTSPSACEEWFQLLKQGNADAEALNGARRIVKAYFEKAARLYTSGLLSENALTQVTRVAGINIYLDRIVPLEKTLDPQTPSTAWETLSEVVGRFESSSDGARTPAQTESLDDVSDRREDQ